MEFTPHATCEDLEHKLRLANDLQEALPLQQLSLHYQPQFETGSGNVRGFEALLRWNHPHFGPISPTEFIPLAEETGLIYSIGDWVIQTACQKNKQIQEKYMPNSVMSVNLSGLQLQDSLFFDRVCGILQQTALSPQSLELELTERDRISLKDRRIDSLKRFAHHGIKIVLDDFGTNTPRLNTSRLSPFLRSKSTARLSHISTIITKGPFSSNGSSRWRESWDSPSSRKASKRTSSFIPCKSGSAILCKAIC